MRWQERWDIAETGRSFYEYKDKISYNRRPDFPSLIGYNRLMQLRTGYSMLNEYRWKIGQKETPYCSCGEIETVKHFMLECVIYDDARLHLLHNLQTQLGITRLDLTTLLGYTDHPEISNWREIILQNSSTPVNS